MSATAEAHPWTYLIHIPWGILSISLATVRYLYSLKPHKGFSDLKLHISPLNNPLLPFFTTEGSVGSRLALGLFFSWKPISSHGISHPNVSSLDTVGLTSRVHRNLHGQRLCCVGLSTCWDGPWPLRRMKSKRDHFPHFRRKRATAQALAMSLMNNQATSALS